MTQAGDRKVAVERARTLAAQRPVFLDTETTGLDATAEVVEICIVDIEGAVLLDSLIRPTRAIPADATAIHGITDGMVRGAPTWSDLWPDVERLVSERHVAIYNADFDVQMMRQSHRAHGLSWQLGEDKLWCVMRLYAAFAGQWNERRGEYRWHKLEVAAARCGVRVGTAHRARQDALLARAVLQHMAEQRDG
jgi:DNA polymerase III subunit epsilon